MNNLLPTLSRRHFLQFSGITLFMSQFDGIETLFAAHPASEDYQGRALSAAPVYAHPDSQHAPICQLWPDSVHSLLTQKADWYHIPEGYVSRTALQPMFATPQPTAAFALAQPVMVTGPVAVVRKEADIQAAIHTRIGHGGILQVVDYLPQDIGVQAWLGLADENGQFIGWSQPAAWSPLSLMASPKSTVTHLLVNRHKQQISAENEKGVLLEAPITTGPSLKAGRYALTHRQLFSSTTLDTTPYYGLPFTLKAEGELFMAGAYWHNQFGRPAAGPAIQLSPVLAQWLYQHVSETASITVY